MKKAAVGVLAALAALAVTVPILLTGTGKTELLQRQHGKPAGKAQVPKHFANTKFSEHPTQHYVPINVSPLGTDALFVGKGDGEGVSMKAHKQQLSIVEKGEQAMEAHMDAKACKAWGGKMARRRALHLTDKVGTPEDRRIALHCGKLFAAKMHQTKVDIAIKMRHAKARQAAAAAKAAAAAAEAAKGAPPAGAEAAPLQQKAEAKKAPAPEPAAAGKQQKAVMQAKRAAAAAMPWWKRKGFGFKKGLHMKKPMKHTLPLFDPKAAQKAKDLAEMKKEGLVPA